MQIFLSKTDLSNVGNRAHSAETITLLFLCLCNFKIAIQGHQWILEIADILRWRLGPLPGSASHHQNFNYCLALGKIDKNLTYPLQFL